MKSNKSISQKFFFDQIQFFAISKMAKNQFLNWKTAKNAISRKKMIYLISRDIGLEFFKFSGPLWYFWIVF